MEEGEAVREGGEATAEDVDAAPDMESRIKDAMRVRVPHFKEQADSLTFEGVRRLIEKDLGLETHALDEHRRFIKLLLLQCLEGGDNDHDNGSKNSGETMHNSMSSNKEEVHELSDEPESKTKAKGNNSKDEKLEGSPKMASLSGKKALSHDNGNKEGVSQIVIKKAIMKRGAYFRANSEKITMSGVRRLLEEDLELEKHSLDSHKKYISEQMELVLQSPEVSESAGANEKKTVKKNARRQRSEDDDGNSASLDDENEDVEEEEEEEKPRKKIIKGRMRTSEGVKKRKVPPTKEPTTSRKKQVNSKEEAADDDNESDDDKGESGGEESPSSPERSKKKEVSTPVYGKQVERLKSIIKSCGMSVPPAIYKKVKQVSESKREAHLMKELEGILSKEGLSTNPSEKEIKDVRKKKERAKELEGIDTSNIVSSSRRRTASRYLPPPPPKPKEPEEEEDSDDEEDGDDDDEDDGEEEDENDDGNEDSQSEEQSEGQEDSD